MKERIDFEKLPSNWTVAELGEHLERITNGLTATQEKNPPGIPVSRIETISDGTVNFEKVRYIRQLDENKKQNFLLKEGDLLFSHINSDLHLGKTAVYRSIKPLVHGMNLLLLRTRKETLDPYYLHYLLNYYRREGKFMEVAQHAVNQSSLNQKKIKGLRIPLAPIDQQKQIVAEIEKQFSRLDEAVANLKRVKANLKRYKAATLKAAVEGKLTEEWRKAHPDVKPASELLKRILAERRAKWKEQTSSRHKNKYVEPQPPNTFDLPRLPEGWTWASCEQICDFITKGTTPASSKLREGKGEIRFLKVYNLTFTGFLDYNHKPAFVDRVVHEGELARSKVQAGDVLINIVGPPLGQVCLVPPEISEANINQAIARFRPTPGILGKFLALVLMTESIMSWAISRAKTTAGQANLTLELCRELPIPVVPIAEQHRIVAEVERCLSISAEADVQIDENLKRGERLRQSILQKAFLGQLIGLVQNSRGQRSRKRS
jgi:type I restriction enzyme, S subunit